MSHHCKTLTPKDGSGGREGQRGHSTTSLAPPYLCSVIVLLYPGDEHGDE